MKGHTRTCPREPCTARELLTEKIPSPRMCSPQRRGTPTPFPHSHCTPHSAPLHSSQVLTDKAQGRSEASQTVLWQKTLPFLSHKWHFSHSGVLLQEWRGTSLGVQWLRVHASTAVGVGSTLRWGTKIPHVTWCGQKIIIIVKNCFKKWRILRGLEWLFKTLCRSSRI